MNKGLEAKNRLVNKCSEYLTLSIDHQVVEDFKIIERELKEHEQYKAIEEELGIDLLTLFKALKDGIYVKKQMQYAYPLALLRTHFTNGKTKYYVYDGGKEKEIKLKDYGKTWALTKEELL